MATLLVCAGLNVPSLTGLAQGSLTPPPGAPAPTMKTLDQIEARVPVGPGTTPGDSLRAAIISTPGSYYLTGAVTSPSGGVGILITVPDVTLDLNGYRVTATGTGSVGISAAGVRVTIRNGAVSGESRAVRVGNGSRLEEVTASSSQLHAILCGQDSLVRHCNVIAAGAVGLMVAERSRIVDCRVSGGTAVGVSAGPGSVVSGSTVTGAGLGFEVQMGVTLSDCTATGCAGDGFKLVQAGAVRCIARGNGGDGFETSGGRSSLSECQAVENAVSGFRMNGTGVIRNCLGNNNSTGFRSESGQGLLIQDNEFSANSSFGLFINGAVHCRIDGNQIYGNGGAPLSLNANGGHLIVRNTAKNNNGSFPSDPSSDIGQVLTNPGNGFFSSNPWANIVY